MLQKQKHAINTTQPNKETRCKNRNTLQIQHNQIKKHTAKTETRYKYNTTK